MAFIVESAGGRSFCGDGSVLDIQITDAAQRTVLSLGSAKEVTRSEKAFC